MPRFDLRDDPWILTRGLDGEIAELSMVEVFRRSHELEAVLGEVPTQTFAVTRLLLAVLHAALVPEPGGGARAKARWQELWDAPTLPTDVIETYLRDPMRDARFDLFDPVAPFFQVAGLHTRNNDVSGLERIIADVPNGEQYFTTRRGGGTSSVSFAEAARWLVHVHAFDTSGIKSGAEGDDRVKGGKGYPLGTGWGGEIGGLLAVGATLKESLLLNTVLTLRSKAVRAGLPVWDREPVGPGVEADEDDGVRASTGVADLYTWQGRRVRLVETAGQVTGVVLAYGDPLRPQNMHLDEPLTSWRYSEPQSKKFGHTVYMPSSHDPDRLLWQGAATMLPHDAGLGSGLSSGLVDWVGDLADSGVVAARSPFDLRAIGAVYGPQSSIIDEIIDDSITIRPLLLAESGVKYAAAAIAMVESTENAVRALTALAGDLEVARGGEPDGARQHARDEAYFSLDQAFRHWLAELGAGDPDVARDEWQRTARTILTGLADTAIADAGSGAWVGRDRRTTGHASSSEAREWFRRALRKALRGAYGDVEKSEATDLEGARQ